MKIEVAKSEIFASLAGEFGTTKLGNVAVPSKRYDDLSFREKRWLVAHILRARNDSHGNSIAQAVESGNPNYNDFVLVDDLPANMGI